MKRVLTVFARQAGRTRGIAGQIAVTPPPAGTQDLAAPGRVGSSPPVVPAATPAWKLSAALAVVTAAGTIPTVFAAGILRGPAAMNGSVRGTALVMLAAGLPVLIASMLAARRGSARAVLLWLGSAAYLAYNAVLLLFATPFNHLFLLYVAMLSLSIWSVATVLHSIDMEAFGRRFGPGLPARGIAVYAWAVVAVTAVIWLRSVVPGMLASGSPAFLKGTGLTTFPTYVQDLAFWLPLTAVAAWWLWQRAGWGFVVVGSMLVYSVLESAGIATDQALGHAADPASAVASDAAALVFAVFAVIGMIPAALFLRYLGRAPSAGPGPQPGDAQARFPGHSVHQGEQVSRALAARETKEDGHEKHHACPAGQQRSLVRTVRAHCGCRRPDSLPGRAARYQGGHPVCPGRPGRIGRRAGNRPGALGTREPLRGQLRIALNSGVSKDEIVDLFIHLEAYAGAARAFEMYQIAIEAFTETDARE